MKTFGDIKFLLTWVSNLGYPDKFHMNSSDNTLCIKVLGASIFETRNSENTKTTWHCNR